MLELLLGVFVGLWLWKLYIEWWTNKEIPKTKEESRSWFE